MKMVGLVIMAVVTIVVLATTIPIVQSSSNDRELDVFVIAGQSNTYPARFTDASAASPIPDPGEGYYFGTADNPSYNKTFNLSECKMYDINDNGSARIGGLFPSFASSYYDKTGHEVYLIDTGLSGVSITTFLPGGVNYDWPGQVLSAAMAAIPSYYDSVNVRGYIWIQGENDPGMPKQTYELDMIRLHDLYSGGALPVDLPTCYICKVRNATGGNAALAQEWLVNNNIPGFEMASVLPDTFTIDNGLLESDAVHYTQAGFNALGVDLSDNISSPPVRPDYSDLMLIVIPVVLVALIATIAGIVLLKNRY